jgi:hypothetical protein
MLLSAAQLAQATAAGANPKQWAEGALA